MTPPSDQHQTKPKNSHIISSIDCSETTIIYILNTTSFTFYISPKASLSTFDTSHTTTLYTFSTSSPTNVLCIDFMRVPVSSINSHDNITYYQWDAVNSTDDIDVESNFEYMRIEPITSIPTIWNTGYLGMSKQYIEVPQISFNLQPESVYRYNSPVISLDNIGSGT